MFVLAVKVLKKNPVYVVLLILQNFIRARVCMILHIINIVHVLILPIVVIYVKYEQIGPGRTALVLRLLKQSLQPDNVKKES